MYDFTELWQFSGVYSRISRNYFVIAPAVSESVTTVAAFKNQNLTFLLDNVVNRDDHV